MVSFRFFICSFVKTRRVMFLINSLYKYFAMNTSFRVSLLYLLLIIPQHGNSPLPVMESWLQKDQDDGVIQRDMTSSLTGGDESFGSAHQTYQNSLIRKKKRHNAGNLLPSMDYRQFGSKYVGNELYRQRYPFFDGRYVNQDFSPSVLDNQKSSGIFEDFDSDVGLGLPDSKFHSRSSNLLMEDTLQGSVTANSALLGNRYKLLSDREKNLNPLNDDYESSPGLAMCKRIKDNYHNNFMGLPQELHNSNNVPLKNSYSSDEQDRSREIRNPEYRDTNAPEGKNPQVFDENEYYDVGSNSLIGDENDYNQMSNNHAFLRKREGSRQQSRSKFGTSEAAKVSMDALKPSEIGSIPLESVRDNMNNAQVSGANADDDEAIKVNVPVNSNLIWKLNSDLQSQALNNVMRNSQRALQEVQQFQQKLYYKPQEVPETQGLKRESRNQEMKFRAKNLNFDEKRLKREDEDEQKNMKTGTDEGGGGEYEDEEGKGHKDEEEYYEDADLSDDESAGNEVRSTDELSQKYVKREAAEDENSKNPKDEQVDNSQDYELNLENAPIENAEKSRKSYREGKRLESSVWGSGFLEPWNLLPWKVS